MHNFFSEFLQIYCVVKTGKSIEIKVLKSILFFAFNIFLPIIANFSNKISVHFLTFLFNESLYIYVVLDYLTYVCHYILDATLFGRRLAFSTKALSCVYIEILLGHLMRRYVLMLTMDLFIAIISLCITCFALGYTVGYKSNNKTQK